jgi:hypothetical protein
MTMEGLAGDRVERRAKLAGLDRAKSVSLTAGLRTTLFANRITAAFDEAVLLEPERPPDVERGHHAVERRAMSGLILRALSTEFCAWLTLWRCCGRPSPAGHVRLVASPAPMSATRPYRVD